MSVNILNGKNVVSARMAKCFITTDDGERVHCMNAISGEFTIEKDKVEVPRLGAIMKAHKSVGAGGTFSLKFHFMGSKIQFLTENYIKTGVDFNFQAQISLEDPTSETGEYSIIVDNCNFDSVPMMLFDADGETLELELDGTFDDVSIPKGFNKLDNII